jgi:hypothetical protein
MKIKRIKATATATFQEFRCVNSYNEWQLFRAHLINEQWEVTHNQAMNRLVVGQFENLKSALEGGYRYATSYK